MRRALARPEIRWLALITAFAAALRFSTLDLQSYSYDEVATTDLVLQSGLWETLRSVRLTESTPPLYYALAWFWTKLFGTGEVGLRSLSALLGTAIVPVAYLAATALSRPRVGLIAALLVAVNPALWWYSQQGRSYILLALLTAVGLWCFAGALRAGRERADAQGGTGRGPGPRYLAGWAVASALALATHYFAIFSVAPEALWLLLALRSRGAWLANAGVGVAGLALVPLAIDQESEGHASFIADLDFVNRLERVPTLFLGGPEAGLDTGLWVLLGAVALVTAVLLWRADPAERRPAAIWGALAGAIVVAPLLATVLGVDYLYARNLIAAYVPIALVLAVATGSSAAGRYGLAAVAVLSMVWLGFVVRHSFDPDWQRTDWRWVAEELDAPADEPGGRVVVVNKLGDLPLSHYMTLRKAPERIGAVGEIVYAGDGLEKQIAAARLPARFELVETGSEGGVAYRRYVSPRPQPVDRADLLGADPNFFGRPEAFVDRRSGG